MSAGKNDENVLSATNDENGDELNGETDDEDMEDGESGFDDGSAQVRNIRDPGQPTANQHQRAHDHTSTLQIMVQILCDGRGVNALHRRSDAQDDLEGVPHVSMDYGVSWREGIRGSCESCAGHPGTETQDDVGNAVSEKRKGVSLDRKESSEVHRSTRAQQSHAKMRQRAGN